MVQMKFTKYESPAWNSKNIGSVTHFKPFLSLLFFREPFMHIDQPQTIREPFDLKAFKQYAQDNIPEASGELTIQQFPSGFSNLTYLITDEAKNEYVLRKPPFGANIKGGHDMQREYKILAALSKHTSKVPKPIVLCTDHTILGSDFYLMHRIKGVILRRSSDAQSAVFFKELSHNAMNALIELHQLSPAQIGLEDLGRPNGYVARQIHGWAKRYERAKTEDLPTMDVLSAWLFNNMPTEQGASLIHNDYKYDNLILDPTTFQVRAILDWEMATIGCPMMDLGATLGYWIDPEDDPKLKELSFSLTHHPGNLRRREFAQMYAEAQNQNNEHLLFYGVYGIWRIVVILQQIYARYVAGHTKDPRFSSLGHGIKALLQHAKSLLDRGHL